MWKPTDNSVTVWGIPGSKTTNHALTTRVVRRVCVCARRLHDGSRGKDTKARELLLKTARDESDRRRRRCFHPERSWKRTRTARPHRCRRRPFATGRDRARAGSAHTARCCVVRRRRADPETIRRDAYDTIRFYRRRRSDERDGGEWGADKNGF